jgi:hypothetical protein
MLSSSTCSLPDSTTSGFVELALNLLTLFLRADGVV